LFFSSSRASWYSEDLRGGALLSLVKSLTSLYLMYADLINFVLYYLNYCNLINSDNPDLTCVPTLLLIAFPLLVKALHALMLCINPTHARSIVRDDIQRKP
jgi:hypothetical protein